MLASLVLSIWRQLISYTSDEVYNQPDTLGSAGLFPEGGLSLHLLNSDLSTLGSRVEALYNVFRYVSILCFRGVSVVLSRWVTQERPK